MLLPSPARPILVPEALRLTLTAIVEGLTTALQRRPPRAANEAELQAILWGHLRTLDPRTVREHTLTRTDRIDFLLGRTGIEVKVKGPSAEVTRQLWRYVESDQIDDLILVTTRREHLRVIGQSAIFDGKPVHVLCIADYLL